MRNCPAAPQTTVRTQREVCNQPAASAFVEACSRRARPGPPLARGRAWALKALHLHWGQEARGHVVAKVPRELVEAVPVPDALVEKGRVPDTFSTQQPLGGGTYRALRALAE